MNSAMPVIYGPDPITIEGCQGSRYWVHEAYAFTGNAEVDERLSGYPVAVFQPRGRAPEETPVVIGMQGMCVPYLWNSFIVPTLLDMQIAAVLFETPFAGERSMVRNSLGEAATELAPLLDRDVTIDASLLDRMMQAVSANLQTVADLAANRHGLCNGQRALFGVSLGTLMASYAFTKDGMGNRLLGTIGHADLSQFARSYKPFFAPLITSLPGRMIGRLAKMVFGKSVEASLDFLAMLDELSADGDHCTHANPVTYHDRVGADRKVRFLVGDSDPVVRVDDARHCASRFSNGDCYVVPGMTHGESLFGPSFIDHVRYYLVTQLSDWRGR